MKSIAKKSSAATSVTATRAAKQPFFAKAGGGDFFRPATHTAFPAVQMKMAVNKPGDKFEQEADKMADNVIRMPAAPSPEEKLQRQEEDRVQKQEQEEETVQTAELPEEKIQKQEQEEETVQTAELPEEKIQKQEEETVQTAELPEEKNQKQEQEEETVQTAELPEEKAQRQEQEEETVQTAELPKEQVQKQEQEKLQKPPTDEDRLQRKGNGAPTIGANSQSAIRNKTTGGQPLSTDVRGYMEPRFSADFSNVRIHSDPESAGLSNQLSARAFTYQNHIFFSREQYQPGTGEGKKLLAHELTHTIQQGHAVQRTPQVSTTSTPPHIQRSAVGEILDWMADKANYIPGFRMFTIVLGVNPINMSTVDRSAGNILRALIEFMPGASFITQALDNHGVFNKIADWVEKKIKALGMVGQMFKNALTEFIDSLGVSDLAPWNWDNVWNRAKRIFTAPIDRLISFAKGVVIDILKFVKDAILKPLAALAQGTRGYDLLKAVLGFDPITDEPVPRNAETLIGGFMKLIGQEEVWENIKKGNAVARAWAWFQGALSGLMGFVRAIPGQIIATLSSLTWQDVITVVGAFAKVGKAFLDIAGRFMSWAGQQVISLLEIIFVVVAPGAVPYIKKAKGAFKSIIQNPVGFVGNLVRAGKLGFQMFASRIGHHLKTALIKWIVGPLADAGVYIPKSFDLLEILKLVLSVLGLTWQAIRAKLVKIIPEPVLKGLEKTVGILVTLVKEGPVAAWKQIKAELIELKDSLIAQITEMVTSEVVKAAIKKLVSMLSPAGAVIQAIIAIYNTITFFIQKISQIAAVVGSFINSIAAIAAGQVANAAKKVEQTMARTLTVVLAFLAKFAGLGNIPEKIVGIIRKIRKPIDKALDKIVAWLGKILKKMKAGAAKAASAIALRFTRRRSFSSGRESHSTWISEEGEPQVATRAMSLGMRIGTWKRRVRNLPTADQTGANAQIGIADTLNSELKKAAQDALRARRASNTAAVDAAQAIIDSKQAALVSVLSQLFIIFGDLSPGRAPNEAEMFALVETYDRVVVPLKQARLVVGTPSTVSTTFKSQWNARQFPQAHGWIVQMERVLSAARNVGTSRLPRLTGVEVRIPGTEIDYTVRDRDTTNNIEVDVAIEVKKVGAMRDRTTQSGRVISIADQINQRIATLRNQVNSSLNDPAYSIVAVEVRGFANAPPAMQAALQTEFASFTARAGALGKQFRWSRI